MRKRWIVVAVVLCALPFLASESHTQSPPATNPDEHEILGSLIRLIVNPARYQGAVLDVTGYLGDERGGLFLFLTRDHADAFDIESSIRVLDRTDEREIAKSCAGSYASVVGTFRARRDGPVLGDDPSFYEIDDIRSVTTINKNVMTVCWKAKAKAAK